MGRTTVVSLVLFVWLLSFLVCFLAAIVGKPKPPTEAKGPAPPTALAVAPESTAKDAKASEPQVRDAVSEGRTQLMKAAGDTFGPQLGVMLAFLFGTAVLKTIRVKDRAAAELRAAGDGAGADPSASMVAPYAAFAVSLVYCAIFVSMFGMCARGKWSVQEANEAITTARPVLTALVTGMVALYFGTENQA